MIFLDKKTINEWLETNNIVSEPYTKERDANKFYTQVKIPKVTTYLTAFTRSIFYNIKNTNNCLVVFDDWSLYKEDEMQIIKTFRLAHTESSELIDKPGIQFSEVDNNSIISLVYLSQMFQWSIYIYFANEQITLYLWEGEIVDIWSNNKIKGNKIKNALEMYQKNA